MAIVALLGVALAPGAVGAESKQVEKEKLPKILQEVRIDQRLGVQVPGELTFRDEAGRTVRLGDYFDGKPHILVLAYYECPKLCTLVLNGLRDGLQRVDSLEIGRDFDILTVSFNPRETPAIAAAKKKNYVASYGRPGAEQGWHFLTGDQASIDRLTRAVGFYYAYDPRSEQFAHSSTLIVLTPDGKVSSYLLGVRYEPKDLRLGLVEASSGKIGSTIDQVLLYCFHYDPQVGKYTADVLWFVRLGGMFVVAGLVTLGVVLFRRDRRRGREAVRAPG
jgi:protein SCO1/2